MAKNEVRIISGKWRGRKLRFADRSVLRPTLGRARETLFNWLGPDVVGCRCLDLFAGSGALGFEAASRGAETVVLVDNDRKTAQALKDNAARIPDAQDALKIVQSNATAYLKRHTTRWDLVFLDPPFASDQLEQILPELLPHLADQALVYWEAAAPPQLPTQLVAHKQSKAGDTHFGLARFAAGQSLS